MNKSYDLLRELQNAVLQLSAIAPLAVGSIKTAPPRSWPLETVVRVSVATGLVTLSLAIVGYVLLSRAATHSARARVFRGVFIAAIVLALFGILDFLSGIIAPRYAQWEPKEAIDFWVAAGTLGLAVVTFASVLVTKAVVSAEDRRHRQSLAPIVEVYYVSDDDGAGFCIRNIGLGPAVNLVGHVSIRYELFPLPNGPRKRSRGIEVALSVVGVGQSLVQLDPELSANKVRDSECTFQPVIFSYHDMFGNRYETSYSNFHGRRYEWSPPQNLS